MKKNIVVGTTLAVVIAGIAIPMALTSSASAYMNSSGGDTLIDALVSKFNLNKSEVQAVFDAERQTRETERQAEQAARLSDAVSAGKLTQAQADKITAKLAEIKASREADRDTVDAMTETERKAHMESERTALQSWADENDIDMVYLMMGGGHGFGRGGMGR